ncbi:hypothetical protein HNP84_004364 [Thermocatellispora tengchongensis]|uniref:Uncharacterized protein n=1 Tax=Thermocatellispora tengchongensis TaxID=1073253 RepID=A0A840P5L2_9ACTN|nr:hypothetical protein [Thermocatellispora tengchongensis]MBB5134632.1 hypothetical protein [Thermocatellispora tengchongensis]
MSEPETPETPEPETAESEDVEVVAQSVEPEAPGCIINNSNQL